MMEDCEANCTTALLDCLHGILYLKYPALWTPYDISIILYSYSLMNTMHIKYYLIFKHDFGLLLDYLLLFSLKEWYYWISNEKTFLIKPFKILILKNCI